MNTSELPSELVSIKDEIVAHIHTASALPDTLNQFEKWFEGDGWDLLIGTEGLVGYALDLQHTASFKFYDSELLSEYELEDSLSITDVMRIEYGHLLIERAMEEYEGDVCPSVHCIKLSTDNKSAVIGCLVEIHGQGGPVTFWQGVYRTQEEFLKAVRAKHIVMFDEIKHIGDQEILNLWNRK
jgi:hypothetical protein